MDGVGLFALLGAKDVHHGIGEVVRGSLAYFEGVFQRENGIHTNRKALAGVEVDSDAIFEVAGIPFVVDEEEGINKANKKSFIGSTLAVYICFQKVLFMSPSEEATNSPRIRLRVRSQLLSLKRLKSTSTRILSYSSPQGGL